MPRIAPTVPSDSVAHDQIRAFVERIERLDEELKSINDDKKEVFAEAKGNGFDTKALKIVIRKRSQDHSERMELEALVELYEAALGMGAAPHYDDYEAEDEPPARAPARTREIIEEFRPATMFLDDGFTHDPETGEITETPEPATHAAATAGQGGTAPSALPADTHQPETATDAYSADPEAHQDSVSGSGGPNGGVGSDGADEAEHSPNPGQIIMERTPPVGVVWHDVLTCFPSRTNAEQQALVEDVRANGVREPIIRQGNVILDGRARYLAARELGIEYPIQEYTGDDPVSLIIAFNLEARKLDLAGRHTVARKFAKMFPAQADHINELFDLDQWRESAEAAQ